MATSLHTIGARTIAIANGIEEGTKVSHVDGKAYSIVTDQLGTPTEAYNAEGEEVWSRRLDMNGNILEEHYDRYAPYSEQIRIPFLFQGQYYDFETELAYNTWIDAWGLTGTYIFTDGKTSYIGKGPVSRMKASMSARIKGGRNTIASSHMDFGNDDLGFMVEYRLMEHYNARNSSDFANSPRLDSPGKRNTTILM